MPLNNRDEEFSTSLFCRSTADGSIIPAWDESRETELVGQFEVGLTVDNRYFIKSRLGDGAMGRVFLAQDLRLDRPVAMKVVAHQREDAEDLEASLLREAQLGANLSHKGMAAVYDFGFHDNKSYTIFEYVEGQTLRLLMNRRGKIPLPEVLQVASDLAVALDFAHTHGVVHRDLKPENICYTKSGDFKILDLGVALNTKRDVEDGSYSGTPAYSSPEQASCLPTDGKSDQYALALVVFEMLTGQRVFTAPSPAELLVRQTNDRPPTLADLVDIPAYADRAVERALSKSPGERFATCQEFVRELRGGFEEVSQRHVVPTPTESRNGFYVAHVADESLLARNLANALETRHFACWIYGRDAIAGVPFFQQSHEAMEKSQVIALLISRASMLSADFQREVEHARKIGCPILPILIDMSREEFEKSTPNLRRLLGGATLLEHRRGSPLEELVDRITVSANVLEVAIDLRVGKATRILPAGYAGPVWATDANQIDIGDIGKVLFRNPTIDDFLNHRNRHFVSATKGFGKTLLLTYKRSLLTQAEKSSNQPMTMVPEGRPFLDFMSEMRSLSSRYEKPLSDLSTTKRLWNAAIRIAAVSHYPTTILPTEAFEVNAFPKRIQGWLKGAKIQPTVVFKELAALRVSELNRLIDDTENFLDQKLRQIHGGICFFVDKVDQAIRHLSRDSWIAIQAGLIEAAWETMNANSHVKVYASIRQEAFSNYQSDIKSNLFAATTSLDYTEDELHALLDQLASCYEGYPTFADMLGFNVIRHGRRPAPEDSFQYVRRHTCGRPRDLVAMASEISSKRASLNEKRLREIVQQTSSTVVVGNIFDEVRVFLNCLGERDARMRFLAAMPSNILEKVDAIQACEVFNGLEPGTLDHFGEDSSEIYHPFRDLYFAGLLGVVEHDYETGLSRQRFRRPHDSLANPATELPNSPVYLLHPALDTFIRGQRTRESFLQYQHLRVGHNLPWEPYALTLMQVERQLMRMDDRRFVEAAHQVLKRIQTLLTNESATAYPRVEIEMSEEWKTLRSYRDEESVEEAMLWLEELLGEA